MKPWNFHSYSDTDWKKHYEPVLFYKWRSLYNDLRHFFDPSKFSPCILKKKNQKLMFK